MNIAEFWSHIEGIKDSKSPAKDLVEILNKLSPQEVWSFKVHFEQINVFAERFDLYYAAYMLIGWCDWEIFCDFRAAMIAKGKNAYESMLKNPDSLADYWGDLDITDDAFGFIPVLVYEKITGQKIPDDCYIVPCEYVFEDGTVLADDENWDFDDETENKNRLPNLSNLYYSEGSINVQNHNVAIITRVSHSDDLQKTYSILQVKRKIN
jgi:hypothetical protein